MVASIVEASLVAAPSEAASMAATIRVINTTRELVAAVAVVAAV